MEILYQSCCGRDVHKRSWPPPQISQAFSNLGSKPFDGFIEIVDMAELFTQHEAVMLTDPSGQGFLQLRNLLPQAPLGQLGQLRGVGKRPKN